MKWRIESTDREIDEPRAEVAIFLPGIFLPFIFLSAMRALSVAVFASVLGRGSVSLTLAAGL